MTPPPAITHPASPNVLVRPVQPGDGPALAALYATLSVDSRRLRFLGAGTLGPEAVRACCDPDHRHAEGFVAQLVGGPDDGAIVGHLELEPGEHASTEVAIAVADSFHHQGIGRRLMAAGLAWAREHRLRHLTATAFADNSSVIGLFRETLPAMQLTDLWDGTVAIDSEDPMGWEGAEVPV